MLSDPTRQFHSQRAMQEPEGSPPDHTGKPESSMIPSPGAENTRTDAYRAHSLRRSERVRNQEMRAEALRRQREERARVEEARAKARSLAAKKAVETKRKQAKEPASNSSETTSAPTSNAGSTAVKRPRQPRKIVKLRYGNAVAPPMFTPVDLEGHNTSPSLFWLRAHVREFLLRFDKLCRLPTRLTSSVNDLLQPWVAEQFKPVIVSLLKLIANDKKPLLPHVRQYITEIDALSPHDERVWDWLLEFVEQLDPYAPKDVPTTEEEQLELVRRLCVICTGTETIRITVMSDADQLRYVEKDAQDEMKQIQQKFKETQDKLAKLKSVDPQVYTDRLASGKRSADNKLWKVQQQLFVKLHKYNTRTAPVTTDVLGNKYWALQYKSPSQSAWGSWILCEMQYDPVAVAEWYTQFTTDVAHVLEKRDKMISEKANERKKARKGKALADRDIPVKGETLKDHPVKDQLVKSEPVKSELPQVKDQQVPDVTLVEKGGNAQDLEPQDAPLRQDTSLDQHAQDAQNIESAQNTQLLDSQPDSQPDSRPDPQPDSQPDSQLQNAQPEQNTETSPTTSVQSPYFPVHDIKPEPNLENGHAETPSAPAPKRRYPKLKVNFPLPFPAPKLYYVEGRENIFQLANWIQGFRNSDSRAITELNEVAEFLSQS